MTFYLKEKKIQETTKYIKKTLNIVKKTKSVEIYI